MSNIETIEGSDENSSRRRGKPSLILLIISACVLTVIGISLWQIFRPLSDMEKRLVGTWRNTTNPAVFTFHADRTSTAPGFPRGNWHMIGDTLYTPDSFIDEAVRTVLRRRINTAAVLTFSDDDHITVVTQSNDYTCHWERVTDQ